MDSATASAATSGGGWARRPVPAEAFALLSIPALWPHFLRSSLDPLLHHTFRFFSLLTSLGGAKLPPLPPPPRPAPPPALAFSALGTDILQLSKLPREAPGQAPEGEQGGESVNWRVILPSGSLTGSNELKLGAHPLGMFAKQRLTPWL